MTQRSFDEFYRAVRMKYDRSVKCDIKKYNCLKVIGLLGFYLITGHAYNLQEHISPQLIADGLVVHSTRRTNIHTYNLADYMQSK